MTLVVFVLAFLLMLLIVAGMAIGALLGREPLKGSCGGLSAVGIEGKCEICGGDPSACDSDDAIDAPRASGRFYDASRR